MAAHFVRILDPGPADRAWCRAIREDTQEECFLYADNGKTVPHKELPINTRVQVETHRAVDDDGRTRWKTNAFPLAMQPVDLQELVAVMRSSEDLRLSRVAQQSEPLDCTRQAFSAKTLYAKATLRRRQKIAEIIEKQQLSHRGAVGDAVGIAIDLCIEHGLA